MTRRGFLAGSVASAAVAQSSNRAPDLRAVISLADLVYDQPVPRSEEGMPVGNGRMGSLVWTTPRQLRFQINRVDVYGNNSASNSFFERHNDYCGGCAYLDVEFDGAGAQRLSVYDGQLTVQGSGATARVFGWPHRDVMAVAIDGQRPVSAVLRMLRFETKYFGGELEKLLRDHAVRVERFNHTATSRLIAEGRRIALTQEFREGEFCCKSAVAVAVLGRNAAPRIVNETDVALEAEAGANCTVLIASAASMDPNADVLAEAFANLDAAEAKGAQALTDETRTWWHDFWSRGHLELSSPDGQAEFVEQNYHYFLYLMASTSRGKFPVKFNGMLWNTGGDLRSWGGQHWFANLSCYYEALPAANRWELMDPMYEMYSGMFAAATVAARQQWGSQGVYIPETTFFDGLEKLPDDIAAEMQELYLRRKPWEERSARFRNFALTKHPHSSRWNWIQAGAWKDGHYSITDRGSGPYGPVNHNFATTAKVAYLYWRRYEFTLDREWLRSRAYPMLAGAAEFYRNHPLVKAGEDGRIHIHWANSNESVFGARDTDEDLSAMHAIFAVAARAAEILEVDAGQQRVWSEFASKLAPIPTSDDPEALEAATYQGPRVFVRGLKPALKAGGLLPDGNSLPMWFFDFCNVESRDRQMIETARATFTAALRNGLDPKMPVGVLSKLAIAAASLGRADAVRIMVPNQMRMMAPERPAAYKSGGVLANRMSLREGPQALDAERLGRASEALHLALLQSNPPAPGEDPILHLFPAWPKEWNARFTLAARGGFVVTASMQHGRIESLELQSQAGAECRLRNPFDGSVVLHRDGRKAEILQGSLLRFATRKGERIAIGPA
jgi:hypothetical protein